MTPILLGRVGDEIEMVIGLPDTPRLGFDLAEACAFHAMFGRVLAEVGRWTPPQSLADVVG